MHDFYTIPAANMTYTRSQNYTNMMIGKYGLQTFEVEVLVLFLLLLSFDVFAPKVHSPYYFWTSGFSK